MLRPRIRTVTSRDRNLDHLGQSSTAAPSAKLAPMDNSVNTANPASPVSLVKELASKHDLNAAFAPGNTEAKPNLLFKGGGMTTLYLNMPPGKGMPVHDHVGCQVTLVCMQGQANVVLAGQPNTLNEGELLTFSGELMVEPRNDSQAPCGLLIMLAETNP